MGKQDFEDDPVAAMERYAQMAAEKESRWAQLVYLHEGDVKMVGTHVCLH